MARDRIKSLRRVKAAELKPNPKNWRLHGETQRNALSAMLEQVGIVDAVIARETDDGLELIDGHLRQSLDPDQKLPVLVVDLDDSEADQVLATLDPLAAMAGQNDETLRSLLDSIDGALDSILEDIHPSPMTTEEIEQEWVKQGHIWEQKKIDDAVLRIHVAFPTEEAIAEFEERLGLEPGRVGDREGSQNSLSMWWPSKPETSGSSDGYGYVEDTD